MKIRDRIRELRRVKASELVPHDGNWRRHPGSQAAALSQLLQDVGWAGAAVARELPDGRLQLIDGHLRASVDADALVPVLVLDVDEDEARRLLLTLDPLGDMAEPDADALRQLAALVGPTSGELAALVADVLRVEPRPESTKGSEQAEIPERPERVAHVGDLWALGRHRLHVGDARNAEAVKLAAGGKVPRLIVTDPPYCSGGFQEAQKAGGTWGKLAGDRLSTRGFLALMREVYAAAEPEAVYAFTDWRMWIHAADATEAAGLALRSLIVWDKRSPALGGLWRAQHELIIFADRHPQQRRKGTVAAGNVIAHNREPNRWHYTQKPVGVLRALLAGDAVSRRGAGPVLDPFCGSGSIFHAAEAEGRTAVGLELAPAVADCALARWQRETGEAPRKLSAGDGPGAPDGSPWPLPAEELEPET